MTNEDWEKILPLTERIFKLIEKWIDQKYPVVQTPHAELFHKDDPPPKEPQTPREYQEQPGRFERGIQATLARARSNVNSGS